MMMLPCTVPNGKVVDDHYSADEVISYIYAHGRTGVVVTRHCHQAFKDTSLPLHCNILPCLEFVSFWWDYFWKVVAPKSATLKVAVKKYVQAIFFLY